MKHAKPDCFDDRAWELFLDAIGHLSRSRPCTPCADCTPEFKTAMEAEGRCSFPGVRFQAGPDGSPVGVRPPSKPAPKLRPGTRKR